MTAQRYSAKYPPKNRTDTGLGVLDIELRDRRTTRMLTPNDAALVGHTGALNLTYPVGHSILSGEPGFGLRTCEIALVLTGDELLRLFRRSLRPAEVQTLLERYGAFHEIHSDFYDEESFEALQPMDE